MWILRLMKPTIFRLIMHAMTTAMLNKVFTAFIEIVAHCPAATFILLNELCNEFNRQDISYQIRAQVISN